MLSSYGEERHVGGKWINAWMSRNQTQGRYIKKVIEIQTVKIT